MHYIFADAGTGNFSFHSTSEKLVYDNTPNDGKVQPA